MPEDFAFIPDTASGAMVIHRADCPLVRVLADAGEPVMTVFGCKISPLAIPGLNLKKHSCLSDKTKH